MKKIIFTVFKGVVWACIAFSIFLRTRLFNMGYEYDELFTAVTSDPSLSLSWIYNNWLMADVHPPLYNVILWIWNHAVPYGPELWLRIPSFLLGLGALACAWFLFPRRLGKTARLLFTALLSCQMYVIAYAQHARSYMLVLLFSVPLTFLFVEMSRAVWKGYKISARRWAAFGVLSLFLAWSHYFGALLFGWFSVLLFVQAAYYKRDIKWFVAVPCLVLVGFLPWLIPNFLTQLEYNRFGGNWWANQMPYQYALPALVQFFFSGVWGGMLAGCMVLWAAVWTGIKCKSAVFPYRREITVLLASVGLVFLSVAIISLKTYMFIGRYFTCVLPTVFLAFVLLTGFAVRRSVIFKVLFIAFLIVNMSAFIRPQRLLARKDGLMPARAVSRFYQKHLQGREIFVVAVEAFPPAVMPAMYGFYVNKLYHLNVPVTELVSLSEEKRERALARRSGAFIWMPNCQEYKLENLAKEWDRKIEINSVLGSVCFLDIFEKGSFVPQKGAQTAEDVDS